MQILVQGVNNVLVACIGMDCRHVAALNADALLQHIGHRGEAVGRARGVRDDLVFGCKLVVVDPHHDGHVGALRRRRDDHAFRPGLEVLRCSRSIGKVAGAFEHHVDAEIAPGELCRVAFCSHRDLAAADIYPIIACGDLAGKTPVHAVVFE